MFGPGHGTKTTSESYDSGTLYDNVKTKKKKKKKKKPSVSEGN